MAPTASAALAPAAPDLAFPPLHAAGGAAPMRFGVVPITEHGAFPPAASWHCWVYLTLNAEIALSLPGNPVLQTLVQDERARISVDGQWVWWALRRKYPERALAKLSGSDLIHVLAAHCARTGRRLMLLGSTAQANAGAVMRLRARHPGLVIAGYAPPAYRMDSAEEERALCLMGEAVEAFMPDYVVMGLGAEREQRTAARLAPLLDGQVTGLLCFGGAIDMASGQVQRAPVWMQRCGLEALFRLSVQPRRLLRTLRVLGILPVLARGQY